MRSTFVSSILCLAVTASAIIVTEPTKNDEIDPSSSFTVKWDSVNTDATSFDLYLVNNAVYPPVDKKIASDIDTSDGSYTVDGLSNIEDGNGYQINLYSNEEHNTGILAQSEQFNVTGSDTSSSSTTLSTLITSTTSSSSSTTSTTTTTHTHTPSTSISTSTETTRTTTTAPASSIEASSTTASASASASDAVASDAPEDTNGAVAPGAPLAVAAGLLGGAVLFNL